MYSIHFDGCIPKQFPKYICDIPMKPLFTGKPPIFCQRQHQVCCFNHHFYTAWLFRSGLTTHVCGAINHLSPILLVK